VDITKKQESLRMKLWTKILMLGLIALVAFAACSKDDDDAGNPATATGTTNADGLATLNIGSYTVDATVTDTSDAGLADIGLTAYLSGENVVLMASDASGDMYPSIATVALGGSAKMGAPSRVQSPEGIASVALEATIIMVPVQLGVYTFEPEPSGMDEFIANGWTQETWFDGSLSDLYNIADTSDTFEDAIFIHLSSTVATAMGTDIRTAVFIPSEIGDFPTFASLLGYNLLIFEGDTLHYSLMAYDNVPLPIFYIDNVTAHRDFWAQFTLVWGLNPSDIDSHLWTPRYGVDSTRYHIYYADRGEAESDPYADLDVDDVTSYGPEHMTIYEPYPGVYTYAIYHFSGSGTIETSEAVVSLLKPNGTVQTFSVPTDVPNVESYWWWWVCTIDGTTGEVETINELHEDPPLGFYVQGMPSKPVNENAR
jgi:hypothetical protein